MKLDILFIILLATTVLGQQCTSNQFVVQGSDGESYLTINSKTEVKTCGGINICSELTKGVQSLSVDNDQISISNGNSVKLPDPSSTNELQQLSLNGAQLSLSDGNSVQLPDADKTNELQNLSYNTATRTLSLSQSANSVDLSPKFRGFLFRKIGNPTTFPKESGFTLMLLNDIANSWKSNYDVEKGEFTIPVEGFWRFTVWGQIQTGTSAPDNSIVFDFRINGTYVIGASGGVQLSASDSPFPSFADTKILGVGSRVQLYCFSNGALGTLQFYRLNWLGEFLGTLDQIN